MSDWPVGLSTGCFYKTSIFDCLETIRNGGFNMIEVCSFPAHLDYHDLNAVQESAKLINELGMEPYSFHAPFSEEIDITSPDKEKRDDSYQELLRAAEAAAIMEVRHLVIHPGPEETSNGFEAGEFLQRIKNAGDALNGISQYCYKLGVGFVLENMLPHLLFGNIRDMLWIMGAIEKVNVGACLDTGHALLSGDLYRVMYKLSGHLQIIHASDNLGKNDDHMPPGKGNINWPRVLTELGKTNFHGTFILELAGNTEKDKNEILSEARHSRRLLRNISRNLDLSTPPTVEGVNSV